MIAWYAALSIVSFSHTIPVFRVTQKSEFSIFGDEKSSDTFSTENGPITKQHSQYCYELCHLHWNTAVHFRRLPRGALLGCGRWRFCECACFSSFSEMSEIAQKVEWKFPHSLKVRKDLMIGIDLISFEGSGIETELNWTTVVFLSKKTNHEL